VTALRRGEAPDGPSRLLPRKEAAETLGISVRTLATIEDAGEIQAVRIRGRVLYDPETLQAYIRRRAGGDGR
jgi:excisionase family DNA binding protein